jgi:hypothetical protein
MKQCWSPSWVEELGGLDAHMLINDGVLHCDIAKPLRFAIFVDLAVWKTGALVRMTPLMHV